MCCKSSVLEGGARHHPKACLLTLFMPRDEWRAGQVHSAVQVSQPLHLVDLSSVALRKLGVTSKQLIDTEKDQCPASRKWAEATLR